jgi:hypothetical protein
MRIRDPESFLTLYSGWKNSHPGSATLLVINVVAAWSGDEEYRQIFNSLMVELVQQLEPACQQAGHVFVASVSRLLERLLGTPIHYFIQTCQRVSMVPTCYVGSHKAISIFSLGVGTGMNLRQIKIN